MRIGETFRRRVILMHIWRVNVNGKNGIDMKENIRHALPDDIRKIYNTLLDTLFNG